MIHSMSIAGLTAALLVLHVASAEHVMCTVCEAGKYCYDDQKYICPVHSSSVVQSGHISNCSCLDGYFKVAVTDSTSYYEFIAQGGLYYLVNDSTPNPTLTLPRGRETIIKWPETVAEGGEHPLIVSETSEWKDPSASFSVTAKPYTTITIPADFQGSLYYYCDFHPSMYGVIDVVDVAHFTCSECTANSFCAGDLQIACTEHAVSLSLSSTIDDCKCIPGYTRTQDNLCEQCPAGSFKSDQDNSACSLCAENTYSSVIGSTDISNCLSCTPNSHSTAGSSHISNCTCNAGFEPWGLECIPECNQFSSRTHDDATCLCDPGYEGNDGVAPSYHTNCLPCDVGYFKSVSGTLACQACPQNTFSAQPNAVQCQACHANSYSDIGSTSQTLCLCAAGYAKINSECSACEPGFFKATISDNLCEECVVGKITNHSAAVECDSCQPNTFQSQTGKSVCHNCVGDSSNSLGHAGCECNAGFEPFCQNCPTVISGSTPLLLAADASCTPCDVGYFKTAVSNQVCDICPAGNYTLSTASDDADQCIPCVGYFDESNICTSCPDDSTTLAGTSITDCKCNIGYTGPNGGVCHACAPGTFKSSPGPALCQNCPAGSVDKGDVLLRDTADNTCEQCETNSYSLSVTECQSCPPNTQAPSGSPDASFCICNVDYEEVAGTCQQCLPGYIKYTPGNELCQACAIGSYYLDNVCEPCPENSSSTAASVTSSACKCIAGHTGNDGEACASCTPGKYKPTTGSAACTACAPNTWYQGAPPYTSNRCISCPENSNSPIASSAIEDCICLLGFLREADVCRNCQLGHYCPAQYMEIQCNTGSSSLLNSFSEDHCVCIPGYVGPSDNQPNNCTRCKVNHYCEGGFHQESCPQNSTTLTMGGQSSIAGCVCNAGLYADDSHECVICPVDFFCANDTQTICPPNSSALPQQEQVDHCICDELFRSDSSGASHCVLCSDNLVCHGSVDGISAGEIEHCSLALPDHPASTNVNQRCVCPLGSFCGDGMDNHSCSATGDVCTYCTENNYCNDNRIFACAENTTSPANSFHVSHCVCASGFYRTSSGPCYICPVGSFCHFEVLTTCSSYDPELTTQNSGSAARSDCICKPGFFRFNTSDLCKLCPEDHFCPSEASHALPNIVACQAHQTTANRGSYSQDQCLCDAGFFSQNTSCAPCASGDLCKGQHFTPEPCDIHDRIANGNHTACVCQAGFEQNADMQCIPCQAGFFKNTSGNEACGLCPDGTYHINTTTCVSCRQGSSSSADRLSCICDSPLHLVNDTCVPCSVNEYYDDGCFGCPALSSTLGMDGGVGVISCHCIDGYFLSGDTTCLPCPPNTYEMDGTCHACTEFASSPEASVSVEACVCDVLPCQQMVFGNCSGSCAVIQDECSECSIGFNKSYASTAGNMELCSPCPLHTYQNETGQALCKDCDPSRNTLLTGNMELNACLCRDGFEGGEANVSFACSACQPGYFKATIQNIMCTDCAIGLFTDTYQSTSCESCIDHAWTNGATVGANTTLSSGSVSADCVCGMGYFQDHDFNGDPFCQRCHRGTYKNEKGMQACDLCGVGLVIHSFGKDEDGAVSSTHCQPCPTHSGQQESEVTLASPMNEITDCQCFPGHDTFSTTACQSCGDYEFKLGYNKQECRFCADGQYFTNHNQACEDCNLIDAVNPLRRHVMQAVNTGNASIRWGQDQRDCVCDLGSFRINEECFPCAKGSFRNETEILTCTFCPLNTYQDATEATSCHSCPENSHTRDPGSDDITLCHCDAGYQLDQTEHKCTPCPAGTYAAHGSNKCLPCLPDSYSVGIAASCTPCGENERSGAMGSTSESFCNCKPGFGSNETHATVCSPCLNNTFSLGGWIISNQRPACTPCPDFKQSPPRSSSASDCVCMAGYEDIGSDPTAECTACQNGQYSEGGHNQACRLCGFGSNSDPASAATSFSDCYCPVPNT